jgi:hypothetical protein
MPTNCLTENGRYRCKIVHIFLLSEGPEHPSHKALPKSNSFVVFVKDELGFSNILELMTQYPWWNIRAKMLVMVKDKSLEPTKV